MLRVIICAILWHCRLSVSSRPRRVQAAGKGPAPISLGASAAPTLATLANGEGGGGGRLWTKASSQSLCLLQREPAYVAIRAASGLGVWVVHDADHSDAAPPD